MSGFDVGRPIFDVVTDERFLPPIPEPEAPTPTFAARPVATPIVPLPTPAVQRAPEIASPELVSERERRRTPLVLALRPDRPSRPCLRRISSKGQ